MSKKKNKGNIYNQMATDVVNTNEGITDESSVDSIESTEDTVEAISSEVVPEQSDETNDLEVAQEPQSQESEELVTEDVSEEPTNNTDEQVVISTESLGIDVVVQDNEKEVSIETPEIKEEVKVEVPVQDVSKPSANAQEYSTVTVKKALQDYTAELAIKQKKEMGLDLDELQTYITLIDIEVQKLDIETIKERMDKTEIPYSLTEDGNILVGPFKTNQTARIAFRKIQGKGLRPCFREL